jgi:hypothetical protein
VSAIQRTETDFAIETAFQEWKSVQALVWIMALRHSANRAWPHLWLLAVSQRNRPEHARGVGESDGESHRRADNAAGEGGRVDDAAIDGVRVDIVGGGDVEATVGIGSNRPGGIAKRATDVHVDIGPIYEHPCIVTAPGADYFGDRRRGRGGAGESREQEGQCEELRHTKRYASGGIEVKR